jgi:hypothetical protein
MEEVVIGARLLSGLPGHLRHRLTAEEAGRIVRDRLTRRSEDFLELVRDAVYANASSPYRALLRHAGCEYGDLERLVRERGLEDALRSLQRHGVYLTVDEAKGRRPAVRGTTVVPVDPRRLSNPCVHPQLFTQSGGTGGTAAPLPVGLDSIRDRAVDNLLALDARGGAMWQKAIWGVPGRSVSSLIRFSSFGPVVQRCFLLVDPAARGLHPRYRWSLRAVRVGGMLAGIRFPRPEYIPATAPLPVAAWMSSVLRSGDTPHLFTFVSAAVQVCQAAAQAGLSLAGAEFTVTGEPVTAARLRAIRATGARVAPDYGSAECGGTIAYGCGDPRAPDEVHLCEDLHALVQPGAPAGEGPLPAGALLVTTLRRTAPLVLLNVSMGDQARVYRRACCCPLERLGWTTLLDTIRSFEKLTAGGMTFVESDLIRVLEEVLPGRFGGGPTDYQLTEEETEDGSTRLALIAPPGVAADDARLIDAFLEAIGTGSGAARVMALRLREGAFLHVERRAPHPTAAGKLLVLFRERAETGA